MIDMNTNSIIKGAVVGLAAGTVAYAVSSGNRRQKNNVKKNMGKALRAVGSVIDGVSCMMR